METSVWTGTLAEFRERVGGTEPVPAGVSISAVSASLALALLAKVLDINGRRKDFVGDRERLNALEQAARSESARLTQLADEDIYAFNQYLESVRAGDKETLGAAVSQTIKVPMDAARSVVRGLSLCAEAANMVKGLTAADLGIASALLSGAVRSMLISVDFNIRQMHSDDGASGALTADCRELEAEARRHADTVTTAISR